jgi:uncharacterized protein
LSSPDNPQLEPSAPAPAVEESPAPDPVHSISSTSDALHPASAPALFETAAIAPPPIAPPPIEDPVFSGWDVLLLAFFTFLSMVVFQLAVLLGARKFVYPGLTLPELAQKPVLLLVSQFLIYLPVAACMILLVQGKYHVRFWHAIRWNWPQSPWTYVGLGVLAFFGLLLLELLLPMPKDTPFERLFDRPRDAYLLSFLAVALAPLMEELFFRGFLYPVLARRLGAFWGIVLTALPFGLLHLQQYGWAWAAGLIIFLVGVVCGVVRATTRSVGASFLVHAAYNGTQMLIAIVATHGFTHMKP